MGLLREIRSNARHLNFLGMCGAVVFWASVGAAVGIGSAVVLNLSDTATALVGGVCTIVGLAVGFYAAFSTTRTARILVFPGAIVEVTSFLLGLG